VVVARRPPAALVEAGPEAFTESRSERRVAVGIGTAAALRVISPGDMVVAAQLRVIMSLKGRGQFLQELDEAGGGLIGQIQRQAYDGEIVRLHVHACSQAGEDVAEGFLDFFGAAARSVGGLSSAVRREGPSMRILMQ
jgi:hypothetical protein